MYSFLRVIIYLGSFMLSFLAMSCVDYEKLLKKNADPQFAKLLYIMLVIALAYMCAEFIFGAILLWQ